MTIRDVRYGIVALLEQVEGITKVFPYQQREYSMNDCPCAAIWFPGDDRAGADTNQLELGHNDHNIDWFIEIRNALDDAEDAQVWAEDVTISLRAIVDAAPLLQPNGAGVVDRCAIPTITVTPDLEQSQMVIEAILETRQSI